MAHPDKIPKKLGSRHSTIRTNSGSCRPDKTQDQAFPGDVMGHQEVGPAGYGV